ncbi:MAG: DHH family phosphoesterase [Candidatus Woesearchaeota archaeon]
MDFGKLSKELDCARPLLFFHDDPDGLASFLLLYRKLKEGKGIVVKSHPEVDEKFVHIVDEYQPDKIFVLDLALVNDSFLHRIKTPVVWIDHHKPQEPRGTHYFNPQHSIGNVPCALVCYEAVRQDLWIAMTGIVGDWYYPELAKEFREKYPKLLPISSKDPGVVLFETPIGKLARVFSFILKGTTQDAMKCVKILTRIESPEEILDRTTPRGMLLYKKFEKINKDYERLLHMAESQFSDDPLLVFVYPGTEMSFTGDLSNELLHKFHNKIIIVGRDKSDEVKCSLRSSSKVNLHSLLQKSLSGVQGYGGGHDQACGAVIKKEDFPRFIDNLREHLKA